MSNYLKIIILPIFTILGVVLIWFFVKPIYDETATLNKIKKPKLETLLSQENELQQRTSKIFNDESSAGQAENILSALPENAESKNIITQLEFLANKENMTLTAISVQGQSPSEQASNGIVGQSGKAYREIGGNIEIKGGYGQFKQLMRDIKKIDRIININQVNVASVSGEEGGAIGKYTINFNIYWQPSLTVSEIKNGLESQEFSQMNTATPGLPTPQIPNLSN